MSASGIRVFFAGRELFFPNPMLARNADGRTADPSRAAEASAAPEAVEPGSSERTRPISTSHLKQKKILIVDDEPEIRSLVARTVKGEGFRADTAADGEEGWAALCQTNYDLLITDHEMPKLKGLALIKRLRAVSRNKPCILMSGQLPRPEPILRLFVHPGAVMAKPFSTGALLEKVRGLLFSSETQAPSAT
jgi:CheY-like chemotaxis protein